MPTHILSKPLKHASRSQPLNRLPPASLAGLSVWAYIGLIIVVVLSAGAISYAIYRWCHDARIQDELENGANKYERESNLVPAAEGFAKPNKVSIPYTKGRSKWRSLGAKGNATRFGACPKTHPSHSVSTENSNESTTIPSCPTHFDRHQIPFYEPRLPEMAELRTQSKLMPIQVYFGTSDVWRAETARKPSILR